jgi:2-iminobutanoate/2-iminopropanoate deaminase
MIQNEKNYNILRYKTKMIMFEKNISTMKKIIHTSNAPAAIGPYSQAVEANGVLFISGQVAINPQTGKVAGGSITEQTEQVMKNIGAILKEAGYTFSDVIKSTCLLSDMSNFAAMNAVYGKYYPENPPARAAFAVKELPLGVLVEIETIAAKG